MIRRLLFPIVFLMMFMPSFAAAQRGAPNPEREAVQQLITRFGELVQALEDRRKVVRIVGAEGSFGDVRIARHRVAIHLLH